MDEGGGVLDGGQLAHRHGGSAPARIRSLEAIAAQLAAPLTLDRLTALVARAGTTVLSADTVLIALYEDVHRDLRVVHGSGLRAARDHAAVARIPPRGPSRGVIAVGRSRAFSQEDRAFLTVLAALSGLAIERLRLSADPPRATEAPRPAGLALRFNGSHVHVGDMEIGLEDQDVVIGGRRARLTPSELRLLLFLAAEPGRVRTRREILEHLWHTTHVGDERACDAHISNLRRKIERNPSRPERVVTRRGVGYTLQL
jgi:Transcriptional regulatory protein, C terminal